MKTKETLIPKMAITEIRDVKIKRFKNLQKLFFFFGSIS